MNLFQTRTGILAACVLTAAACATGPDYGPARSSGGEGYSSQQIEANRYRVSYTGDLNDSAQDVRDRALLRAAELTLENGGDWFEITSASTNEDTETRTRFEDRGFETESRIVRDCGLLGCTSTVRPVTTYGGVDQVEETSTVYDHSMEILIHSGLKPLDNPNAYEAAQTAVNLRASLD
ncbi:MAG: hypothetical protein MRY64_04860 [Hyphomonadaceae bacterium]|nr:hypothetical protein [Hyphomonadaceae bacterium]